MMAILYKNSDGVAAYLFDSLHAGFDVRQQRLHSPLRASYFPTSYFTWHPSLCINQTET